MYNLKYNFQGIKKLKKNLVAINKEYKKKIVNLTLSFLIIKNSINILWLNFVLCNSKFISNKLIKYLRK